MRWVVPAFAVLYVGGHVAAHVLGIPPYEVGRFIGFWLGLALILAGIVYGALRFTRERH